MLPVAVTIAAALGSGVFAEKRLGARAGILARRLMAVILFGVVPFVYFCNLSRLRISADVGARVGLGWIALLLAGGLGWLVARRLLHLPRPSSGTLAGAAMQGNSGYLGVPLVAATLGGGAVPEAVAYDALVQAPVFLLAVFAVAAATGTKAGATPRERLRAFVMRNPPLVAAVAGLLVPAAWVPDVLVDVSRIVILAMLPLGFFAVGVTLGEEAEDGRLAFPPPFTARVGAAVVLRLLLAPALLIALAAPLLHLPHGFLLPAAMPVGINAITVAHVYGLDVPFAASNIAWSTAIGVAAGLLAVAFF